MCVVIASWGSSRYKWWGGNHGLRWPESPSRNDTHAGTWHKSLLGAKEIAVKAQRSESWLYPRTQRNPAWLGKKREGRVDGQEAGRVSGAGWWGWHHHWLKFFPVCFPSPLFHITSLHPNLLSPPPLLRCFPQVQLETVPCIHSAWLPCLQCGGGRELVSMRSRHWLSICRGQTLC